VLRQQVAGLLADTLEGCGIRVATQTLSPGELFAPGPDGPLFGRHFDLAAFSWEAGQRIPCFLYTTSRIPTAENHWVGENITGYSNPEFDAACQAALQVLPGQPGYAETQAKPQQIFTSDLPVIPLYQHIQVAASRPDFCGFTLNPGARSSMWNVEAFDTGPGCNK
jgi:peptide/nickel transport system substrate-binding protein